MKKSTIRAGVFQAVVRGPAVDRRSALERMRDYVKALEAVRARVNEPAAHEEWRQAVKSRLGVKP